MVVIFVFKLFGTKKEKCVAVKETEITQPSSDSGKVNSRRGELSDRMSDKKLVAIITSAIAASKDESDCAFNVISINKIS